MEAAERGARQNFGREKNEIFFGGGSRKAAKNQQPRSSLICLPLT